MAMHRCVEGFVVGQEGQPDLRFIEHQAYDDSNDKVAEQILRFPDYFVEDDKAPVKRTGR